MMITDDQFCQLICSLQSSICSSRQWHSNSSTV